MAKAFSLASWNVEHFKGAERRTERVLGFLTQQDPDVFALYEVEGRDVFPFFVESMQDYQIHITEGPQVQEIMVGVKRDFSAFFTQKVEYKRGMKFLRPGALLTLNLDDVIYVMLFLHTKSGSVPLGLGIRDDQFRRAFKFKKKVLDRRTGGPGKANFMFLGDLNTMGMVYPFNKEIVSEIELKKLDRDAAKAVMCRLTKNQPHTWWNGPGSRYRPADLDQVVASEQVRFKQFNGADIDVRGWPELTSERAQARWIGRYSDHGLLYLEVQKV